jgi:replicative DNA helicase
MEETKVKDNFLERVPPQNIDAEKAVIASMILDNEAISKALEAIESEDFYVEAHKTIYKAIMHLYDKSTPVDLVTLSEELISKNSLDDIGGATYLNEITRDLATSANVDYYIKIVKEKSELRNLILTSMETIKESYESDEEVSEIIDRAESRIFEVADKKIRSGLMHIRNSVNSTIDFLEKVYHNKGHITGIPSGFTDLDNLTAGFQKSDLIIIAARPSVGKTALILNMSENMGIYKKFKVAIFSLEMSKEQLCQRFICSYSKIDSHKARTGNFGENDFTKITQAAGELMHADIYIDDSSQINVLEMKAKCRRLKAKEGLDAIFVDYLQLLSSPSSHKYENRQTEVAKISRSLKQLARELEVPVIAAAQLNRMVETRPDKRPLLSDLRDSGAIEQDADLIMFLHRENYQKKKDDNQEKENDNQANDSNKSNEKLEKSELIIAKQRNGPTGIINLAFRKQYTRFENYAEENFINQYNDI